MKPFLTSSINPPAFFVSGVAERNKNAGQIFVNQGNSRQGESEISLCSLSGGSFSSDFPSTVISC